MIDCLSLKKALASTFAVNFCHNQRHHVKHNNPVKRNKPIKYNTINGKHNTIKGFTLIELLIVLVVVGLVTAIALPSYLNSVRKSHRKDAQYTMKQIALSLEQFYTLHGKFMSEQGGNFDISENYGNRCLPRGAVNPGSCEQNAAEIRYFMSVETTPTFYTITAFPKNDQLNDPCGTMTLDKTNTKTLVNTANDVGIKDCW